MAASVVLVFVLNKILLNVGGSEAVAANSVLMTIGNVSSCISTGVGSVSLTLSGILYNEEDRTGLRELLRLLVRYAVMPGAAVGALPALCAWLCSLIWGVTGVWLYFVLGEGLALLLTALYVWKKNGGVTLKAPPFLLLSQDFGVQKENLLEMDIHSIGEVVSAAEQAQAFCLQHGQSEKMANHIALCVEEMASNTVRTALKRANRTTCPSASSIRGIAGCCASGMTAGPLTR